MPPTNRNIDIHKTIAAKEKIPGQKSLCSSVKTMLIIIDTPTKRLQKISKIPPKIVGFLNHVTAPSNVSIKKKILS